MAIQMRDHFACSPSDYWHKVFLREDFQRALYTQGLGFGGYTVDKDERDPDGAVRRVVRVRPPLPKILEKVLGGAGYTETGHFDPVAHRYTFEIIPAGAGGRVKVSGAYWTEPSEGGCERCADVQFSVRIPGIGGRIQKAMESMTAENQHKGVAFTRTWIAERMG